MTREKKGFNWTGLVIIVLILALIGFLAWWIFGRGTTVYTTKEFENRVQIDKADENDKNYFSEVKYDRKLKNIYVVEHQDKAGVETDVSYTVGVPSEEFADYYFNPTILVNGKAEPNPGYLAIESASLNGATQNPVYSIPGANPSIWPSLLVSFLPLILIIVIGVWLVKKSKGGGSASPFGAGKNRAIRIKSDKKFSDVAGNEEVKTEVMELVDYLVNPADYRAAGARIPKGILMEGPAGTGKTLIAKATAGEAKVPFYFVSGSNFVEMFVGVGASRVRELFKDARKDSPCIIFIDELDAVGRVRGTGLGGGNDEREQTLNQLLVEMDGIEEARGVLIIAATNRADVLDPALLRPGRFDRVIKVSLPDIKEREAILKLHAVGKQIDPSVNFKNVAKRTPGYSGAQLENVINEAAILAVRQKTQIITLEDIDEAIDRVLAGPARKSRVISPEELKMVAYHEAGHAVIGLKLPGGRIVQKITIIPRGNAGGYNLMTPEKETYNLKKSELIAQITSFMGGRAAEEIVYGKDNISTGAGDDIKQATLIARAMVTQFGMSELGPIQYESGEGGPFLGRDYMRNKDFSDKVGYEIDYQVRHIISFAEKEAHKIIKANPKLHKAIAEALLEKETINAEEITYISKHYKLPPVKKRVKPKKTKKSLTELITAVKKPKVVKKT